MARGDKSRFNQQQSSQLGWNSGLMNQALGENSAAYNALMPGLQAILSHPGYSDAEKQSILSSADSALGGAYGDAQQQLASAAARTGNAAGLIPAEEEMARAKSRGMSQQAGALAKSFADAALNQRNFALQGLAGLYRNSIPLLGAGLGSSTSLIGDQARLAGIPGIGTSAAQGAIGAGLGLLPAIGLG